MDIDGPNTTRRNLPHYGTTRYMNTVEPTIPKATNVAELFEEYK